MIKNKVLDSVGVSALWTKLKDTFIDEAELETVVNVIQGEMDNKATTEELNTLMTGASESGEFDGCSIFAMREGFRVDSGTLYSGLLPSEILYVPNGKGVFLGDLVIDSNGNLGTVTTTYDEEWEEFNVSPLNISLKGEKGLSGVYVGSGDMPVGYNVQVDTTGGDGSPILRVRDGAGVIVEIPAIKGDTGIQGEPGQKGDPGYTPIKGTDYFTQNDKDEIVNQTKQSLGAVYRYKGTVEDTDALTALETDESIVLEIGDTYNVTAENGVNFVWTGEETGWDAVGQVIDVSNSVISGDLNPVSGDAVFEFVQGALALYDEILMGELG